jgi:hypothetical protein
VVFFAVRHVARRTAKSGQGARLTTSSAVRQVERRTTKVGPWRTVGYGLCRAPRGAVHGKGWFRRPVHQSLCRASSGLAHGNEWLICRASAVAHSKGTILAAILAHFAVRLPHAARQIDLIFLFFFCF